MLTVTVVNCRASITLRETPSIHAAELAQIPCGQIVGFIDDIGNGFYKNNYDGFVGFVLAEYLSPQKSARTATVVNRRASITLRETPSGLRVQSLPALGMKIFRQLVSVMHGGDFFMR